MSLYRKYRSQKFKDLVGQDHIRDVLLEAVSSDKLSHAYLLAGPRGTGKTSTARLIAKAANCLTIAKKRQEKGKVEGEPCDNCQSCSEIVQGKAIDIIEIDAASNRGIEEIRELRQSVKFSAAKLLRKVYIIDEAHMLTREAFNALLKTLEEPPEHVIFILATTEAHKIPLTIMSRAQRFDFVRITQADIITNLKKVAKAENIDINDEGLDIIASMAEGGHRDALSLLEQAAVSSPKITKETIENILGVAKNSQVLGFVGAIFNTQAEEGLKIAQRLFSGGFSLAQFNKDVIKLLREVLIFCSTGDFFLSETEDNKREIEKLASDVKEKWGKHSSIKLLETIDIFIKTGNLLKDVSYPILPLEMAVVETCALFSLNEQTDRDSTHPKISADIGSPKNVLEEEAEKKAKVITNINSKKSSQIASVDKAESEIVKSSIMSQRGSPSVPVLEVSGEQWQKIIEVVKSKNNTLAALLRDTKPLLVEGNNIVLGVKFPFHKDKISENVNIKVVEQIASSILGSEYRIECRIADLRNKPTKSSTDNELLSEAEEIFGS